MCLQYCSDESSKVPRLKAAGKIISTTKTSIRLSGSEEMISLGCLIPEIYKYARGGEYCVVQPGGLHVPLTDKGEFDVLRQ